MAKIVRARQAKFPACPVADCVLSAGADNHTLRRQPHTGLGLPVLVHRDINGREWTTGDPGDLGVTIPPVGGYLRGVAEILRKYRGRA